MSPLPDGDVRFLGAQFFHRDGFPHQYHVRIGFQVEELAGHVTVAGIVPDVENENRRLAHGCTRQGLAG